MSKWKRHCGKMIFAMGVLMVLYGIHRGEVATVLSKGVRICLECIGVG